MKIFNKLFSKDKKEKYQELIDNQICYTANGEKILYKESFTNCCNAKPIRYIPNKLNKGWLVCSNCHYAIKNNI